MKAVAEATLLAILIVEALLGEGVRYGVSAVWNIRYGGMRNDSADNQAKQVCIQRFYSLVCKLY